MDLARTPALTGGAKPVAFRAPMRGVLHLLDTQTVDSKAFRQDWKSLALRAAEPNPFFESWFTLPSFEQFADSQDFKLAAYWIGGRLAGIMPLRQSSSYYGHSLPHVSTWLHNHSFCGAPLVANGCEKDFWKALLACLDRAPGPALFMHLPALPENGPLDQALTAVLQESGRANALVDRHERAMLSSDLSAEDYLAQAMSAKKRKELRRQHKRLCELGNLTFERLDATECIEPWIEQYLTLEAAGWKGDAGSALKSDPASYTFFADAIYACAHEGRLERLALRLDGKPIAMLANFVTAPGAYSFKTAFDEDYARFSPGLLLQLENLKILNRAGIAWTDSCAIEGHSMIERIWREKRKFISRNIAIGGSLRRLTARALMAYETRERG